MSLSPIQLTRITGSEAIAEPSVTPDLANPANCDGSPSRSIHSASVFAFTLTWSRVKIDIGCSTSFALFGEASDMLAVGGSVRIFGCTPLHWTETTECIRGLIGAGTKVNAATIDGNDCRKGFDDNPLHYAAGWANGGEMIALLFKSESEADARKTSDRRHCTTLRHLAIWQTSQP